MSRYENRVQLALALVIGLLLIANLFTLTLVALSPTTRATRAPVLFTVFVITLIVSIPSLFLIPRWLLKPYRQLVDEAERAPVTSHEKSGALDETEFVLKTFQEVVSELGSKQRELERLGAQAKARAVTAEKFSERIVASVPSGLLAVDSDGRATIINGPARRLLNVEEAGVGQSFKIILGNVPELAELIESCMKTGEVFRREEVSANFAGGVVRRLGVTVAPIEPQPGAVAGGALCLLTDITEVAQLREAVALKKNLESLGEMSAGLAHEFKNALATLHGYAQLLQSLSLDESGHAAAAALLQEVRNVSDLVNAFLNFARPRPLELSETSLDEIIVHCAEELRMHFDEHRVSLQIEGAFPDIRADERMLRQALLNLLRNAAEAIPEESSVRQVTLRGSLGRDATGREEAVVEIEDTGTGIPNADLQRIFIPFFTTKSQGHGVGLALAHRVITDHGGTLSARNGAEGGAVFTIRLPSEGDCDYPSSNRLT